MNFVIFSYNFLPGNDAEAYCTTRFASALAHCGHNVHVVTMERESKVSQEVYDFLVDKRVKITRVPDKHLRRPIFSRLRYVTNSGGAENISACIRAVRSALKGMESPILISRSNPMPSMIVGWHCRKWAKMWIAHASDPIPIPGRNMGRFDRYRFEYRFWVKRAFRDADYFSVTCPNAIRAFQAAYGNATQHVKFVVTPHIGHPELTTKAAVANERASTEKQIVHQGVMCNGRGGPELASAVTELNREGVKCAFVQVGMLENETDIFAKVPFVRRADSAETDVVYIPDLQVPLPYCAFLSSKMVYQLYYDKPILLYSHHDGASADLARKFPEAGIFFADVSKPDSLKVAAKAALDCDPSTFDRRGVRELFTRERVVNDFIRSMEQ